MWRNAKLKYRERSIEWWCSDNPVPTQAFQIHGKEPRDRVTVKSSRDGRGLGAQALTATGRRISTRSSG